AEHADPRGCESFPSLERVAWMTGFSTRWVRSLVSDLRSLGVLVPERRANQRRPTTYKIQVDALRHRSDGRSRGSTEPAPRKEPSVREERYRSSEQTERPLERRADQEP